MKKNSIVFFVWALLTAALVVSCGDGEKPAPDFASRIAGAYTGTVELTVAGSPVPGYTGAGKKLVVTRITSDSVSVALTVDYNTGPMVVEKVTAGARVTQEGDRYILTGGETVSENITAVLTGEIGEKGVEASIAFTPGSMPFPITAKFTGKAVTRTVTVNASDYMKWRYFSFEDGLVGVYTIQLDGSGNATGAVVDGNGRVVDENSFDWDVALHREDVRTNGGSALNTGKKEMAQVTEIPASGYVADAPGEVVIDLSRMLIDGTIKYAPFTLNQVLTGWLAKNLTQMPPVYTIHGWVYIIRTKEGRFAKIKFTDRTNDTNVSGHITFIYEYPVE